MRSSRRPPVLLTFGGYSGTLAAVRCLGELGVPITVADPEKLASGKWSRYVMRRETCPPVDATDAFLDWLVTFCRRHPGHVLCSTSDDMTWLIAQHGDLLSTYYHLCSPSLESVKSVLDKESLHALAAHVGIATPKTFYPKDETSLEALADTVRYPVLVKLRTQVFRPWQDKGRICYDRQELLQAYRPFIHECAYALELLVEDPDLRWPMVQEYYRDASAHIYSLCGFVERSGTMYDFRASRKVLQYPQRLGVGICFESEAVDTRLRDKLLALCNAAGYWGVLMAEFIETSNGERLLIDINPRFYQGLWFEVVRGMPLPVFAYFAALQDFDALHQALEESRRAGHHDQPVKAVQGARFFSVLAAKVLTGAWRLDDMRRWLHWYRGGACARYDLIASKGDFLPAVADALHIAHGYARHPGGFFRSMSNSA